MRFSPLIFAGLIAQAQAQTAPMTAADAFAAGKSSGDQAAVKSAFDSVTSAKGSEIIPGYSASTPPQSSYWSPSALIGSVLSGGVAKIAECDGPASSDPKIKNHCEAVQALAKQPSLRPPGLITTSYPLIVKGDAITNNPEAIAGAITGIYSACTTKTVSLGKDKQTETCEDYATTGTATCEVGYEVKVDADHLFKCLDSVKVSANASCTVGRLITVDADANYQCTQAPIHRSTSTCMRNLSVTCAPETDGCSNGEISVIGSTAGMKSNYLSVGGGNYALIFGTISRPQWHGNQIYSGSLILNVSDIAKVTQFYLARADYQVMIAVWLNGTHIYSGPWGGTDIYFNCAGRAGCGPGHTPTTINTSATSISLGINMKPYLITGTNTLTIKMAGSAFISTPIWSEVQVYARLKCPRLCDDVWDNQCIGLENRST